MHAYRAQELSCRADVANTILTSGKWRIKQIVSGLVNCSMSMNLLSPLVIGTTSQGQE